jgi:hypothetical protein
MLFYQFLSRWQRLPVLPALPVKILPVRREGREGVVLENYGLIGLLDRIA